ncbi:MAG: hypothetical protein A3K60_03620 [Euryarchaeota archaeon RBG_19FT_COMBO_56_21]|nr:MAG: hypothetical protein A3K60_03620 [Euryarchaeota archaeon RBG_19FT_COMBO_56_21]
MSVLSFFRYPLGSVVRNKRRSLFAIAGIVIALSLISGSWIAVDSSGMGLLRSRLSKIPVDFVALDRTYPHHGVNETYVAERVAAIESVDDVIDVAAYAAGGGWYYANSQGETLEGDWQYNFSGTLMFLSQDNGRFFSAFHVTGELPDPGTIAIPEYVADQLNVTVGDSLICRYESYTGDYDMWGNYTYTVEYLNLSFAISKIWTQDKSSWSDDYYWSYVDHSADPGWIDIKGNVNPVVFNLADLPLVDTPATVLDTNWGPSVSYFIWVDRDRIIDLADLRGSLDRLEQLKIQLDREGMRYDFYVNDSELLYPLQDLIPRMEGIKPLFVALSLPIVALGAYLSIVGVDLGVSERKREIAILKSRGASNRQVFVSLIMESFLLGTFSGVLGLILGVLVSRFLLDAATIFSYQGEGNALTSDFMISAWTIIYSVIFGIGLMIISSYRPFKKISKADVREALHYYSPTVVQIDYKPKMDIIFLSLSILSIISIWIGFDWANNLNDVSWITRLILGLLVLIGILIFPLMPFLLSLSVIRLLTRGSRKLYAKLTFIVRPWTKELHYLVDKNIVRNPRRASNLCLIIALSLAFGLFISVTMESTMRYQENLVKFEVGSDIKTESSYYWGGQPEQLNPAVLQEISSVEGIESHSTYESVRVSYGYYGGYYGGNAVSFDALAYKETVRPNGFYFVDGGRESLDDLASLNGTLLIVQWLAEDYGISVGDDIPLTLDMTNYSSGYYEQKYVNYWGYVVGIVKSLPGLESYSIYMDQSSMDFVPVQNRTEIVSTYGVFVDVADGYEQAAVAEDIDDVFIRAGMSPNTITVDEKMEELNNDPAFRALTDFLYMEYVLSVVIMTIGVGILIFVAVNDREKELASIMARGSSAGQIRKILMGESFTLMVLGLVVGASVGLLTAYLFQTLYAGDSSVVPREMLFTWVSGVIVVASVGALVIASLVATSRAGKIKLAEVLRIRGG